MQTSNVANKSLDVYVWLTFQNPKVAFITAAFFPTSEFPETSYIHYRNADKACVDNRIFFHQISSGAQTGSVKAEVGSLFLVSLGKNSIITFQQIVIQMVWKNTRFLLHLFSALYSGFRK